MFYNCNTLLQITNHDHNNQPTENLMSKPGFLNYYCNDPDKYIYHT